MLIKVLFIFLITLKLFANNNIQNYNIDIEGNQRISNNVIHALAVQTNVDVDSKGLNSIIKTLYKTGLFSEITISSDEKKQSMNIKVKENPVVNEIVSRGSNKIDLKKISTMLSLRSGRAYNKESVKTDLEQLIVSYRKIGYRDVKIEPYVNFLDRNRVDVIFDIKKGKKHVINNIYIHNNKKITNRQLKNILKSKEGVLWNNKFEPETLEVDKENIESYYTSKGFKDAKVEKIEIIKNDFKYNLHYYISENSLFKINKITYDYRDIHEEEITNKLQKFLDKNKTLKQNDIFSEENIKKTATDIENFLMNQNLPSIKIDYTTSTNQDKIDVNFSIKKDTLYYINEVIIKGNRNIPDKVIRIEVLLSPGDVYNKKKLEQTKQRLNISGYFQTVNIEEKKLPNNMIDIVIDVKEVNTLNLGLSIGYNNLFGAIGEVNAQKKALFNNWYDGGFTFSRSGWQETYAANIYNRHFKGTDLGLGIDVFSSKSGALLSSNSNKRLGGGLGYLDNMGFESNGVSIRTGYRITENLTQSLFTTVKSTDSFVKGDFAKNNQILAEQYYGYSTHMIGHSLSYDKRDNSFITTKGYAASLKQFVAGSMGIGSQKFTGNEVNFSYYKPLFKEALIFNFNITGGILNNFGNQSIGSDNRYSLGYYNLRGFSFLGAGPTVQTEKADGSTQNLGFSIRGNKYFSGTFDLSFPISGGESPLRGSVFFDFGTLTGVDGSQKITRSDGSTERILDSGLIRTAVGVGIVWHSSIMGPIRLDFAQALQRETYDRTVNFMIRIGNVSGF